MYLYGKPLPPQRSYRSFYTVTVLHSSRSQSGCIYYIYVLLVRAVATREMRRGERPAGAGDRYSGGGRGLELDHQVG